MSTVSQRSFVSPFCVEHLPLLARLHRLSFRGGCAGVPTLVRLAARGVFHVLRDVSFGPVPGRMRVNVAGVDREAKFDARNRQFGALYFDEFADGYEPEVAALLAACVADDGVLYDVGSNWGYFSLLTAARRGFQGRVHAFEPWPASFRDLSGLVRQLELGERIVCHNLALGETPADVAMRAGSHSGLAHLTPGRRGVRVAVRPLDELELEAPSLIKIDTEGHEEQVLRGGRRLLAAHRPMIVFEHRRENDYQWQNAGVLELLDELGYRLFVPRLSTSSEAGEQCEPGDVARGLELLEVDAASRASHPDDGNLFACHVSRLDELAALRGVFPAAA